MMEFFNSLQVQVAIVTSGARGFGLVTGRCLSAAGCRTALWDGSLDGFDEPRGRLRPGSMLLHLAA